VKPWQRSTFITSLLLEDYGKMLSGEGPIEIELLWRHKIKEKSMLSEFWESLTSCLDGRWSWVLGIESERV
jgi:hypothetical protein